MFINRKIYFIAGFCLLLAACDTKYSQHQLTSDSLGIETENEGNYLLIEGDSVTIPPFEVEVESTVRADTRLMTGKESLIVSAIITGIPKVTTLDDYRRAGEIGILQQEVKLKEGRIARFDELKFSKKLYESLSDNELRLMIRVYSGQISSPANLLDCGVLSGELSTFIGKRSTVRCSLIEEKDQ